MEVVCPDDLRREILGDVSDQSEGHKIFTKARELLWDLLMDGKLVFFDATNLGKSKTRVESWVNEVGLGSRIINVGLEDSDRPDICAARVRMDLAVGKDRSKVPEEVVYDQYEKWMKTGKENMIMVGNDISDLVREIEAVYLEDIPF